MSSIIEAFNEHQHLEVLLYLSLMRSENLGLDCPEDWMRWWEEIKWHLEVLLT